MSAGHDPFDPDFPTQQFLRDLSSGSIGMVVDREAGTLQVFYQGMVLFEVQHPGLKEAFPCITIQGNHKALLTLPEAAEK